ncbi:MAG: N-acetylglucosamine-6-phosphate deacetylase [Leadbetterella sp.]|nr:N-acetylglucosamine-6-phosphate deacetylase [Leadbetterella sp.]
MEITTRHLYTSGKLLEKQRLKIEDGIIHEVSDYPGHDFDYENLAPALVDIHINGGEKYHFTADPTAEALEDIEFSAQKNGVGYLLPALITSSPENIFAALDTVREYIEARPGTGIMGLHLEGPFISEKKRGAHLSKYIRVPDDHLLREIIDRGGPVLKMMTIAPEHFTDNQVKMLLEAGVKVSLGHSDCSYTRAMEAFDLGVNLVTHLFNAMSSFHHREPGLAGAALMAKNVYTPVIPDGVHARFEAVQLALEMKKEHLLFISDALFQNHQKETFRWEEFDARLIDGDYINTDGNLAGATISMADAVRNGVNFLGLSLEQALYKSSGLPAEVLGFPAGKAAAGYPARLISFSENFSNLKYLNFQ